MSLTTQTDSPELTIVIGSEAYSFSELPVSALAKLQVWIRSHVPHPLDALKGHLDGLDPADRATLLENARREARNWPPDITTADGKAAIMDSEHARIEALAAGLAVHHPELSRSDAERIYHQLRKDTEREARRAREAGRSYDGERGAVRRIYGVLFNLEDVDDDLPKG